MLVEFFVKMRSPFYLLFFIYPNVPLTQITDLFSSQQLLVLPPTWADINNGRKSRRLHTDQPVLIPVGVQTCTQTFYIRHFPALNNTKPHRIVVGVFVRLEWQAYLPFIHPRPFIIVIIIVIFFTASFFRSCLWFIDLPSLSGEWWQAKCPENQFSSAFLVIVQKHFQYFFANQLMK